MPRPLRLLPALLLALLLTTAAQAQTSDVSADSLARSAARVSAELLDDVDSRTSAAYSERVAALAGQARNVANRRDLRALRTSADALRFDTDRNQGRLLATLDQVIEAIDAALSGDTYTWHDSDGTRSATDSDYEWHNTSDDHSDDSDSW